MMELLGKAWQGWTDYIDDGKLPALLFAALFFLWLQGMKAEQKAKQKVGQGTEQEAERKTLLLYTTGAAVCCVLPLTAAVLMLYQTKFYDYEWIWSMVPLTAVAAWGGVAVLEEIWPKLGAGHWRKGLPGAALLLAAVLLCGSLGPPAWDEGGQAERRQHACDVIHRIKEIYPGETLCLWAPQEIMEYAREADGEILLPYGRNMWDMSLNGYSYDIYGQDRVDMYRWMEGLQGTASETVPYAEGTAENGSGDGISRLSEISAARSCADYAVAAGVTCILLPESSDPQTVQELEKTLQVEAQKLEGYWIFYGWAD